MDDQVNENDTSGPTGPVMRYIGNGNRWPTVPARDLSADEWAALDAEMQALVISLKLYEPVQEGV